jgi:hypothetical protein
MGDLPNADGFVTGGINDAGQIVGYYPDRFLNVSHGFLATPSAPANRAPVASNITANENEDASPVTLDALFTDPLCERHVHVFSQCNRNHWQGHKQIAMARSPMIRMADLKYLGIGETAADTP